MVPADVDSPEFCLGLQTLLSLKVRHPCLGLTQNARTGKRIRLAERCYELGTCLLIPKRKMKWVPSLKGQGYGSSGRQKEGSRCELARR